MAAALELLELALDLWTGDAFASLDTPWFDAVREGLASQRLTAFLDRNDLALGQGRHAELLGELSLSAAAHPLDERLAGQLMLALYRCGRQAEPCITTSGFVGGWATSWAPIRARP